MKGSDSEFKPWQSFIECSQRNDSLIHVPGRVKQGRKTLLETIAIRVKS